MRRAGLAFGAAALLATALWWRSDRGAPAGWWSGTTSQGQPVEMFVARRDGGLVIDLWRMVLVLRCDETGRAIRLGIGSALPVPLRDGRFLTTRSDPSLYHRFGGAFEERGASGRIDTAWPALTGTSLDKLGAEKCAAQSVSWSARRVSEEERGPRTGEDVKIEIDARGVLTARRPGS